MMLSLDGSPGQLPSTIAAGRFSVGQQLGAGSFGTVHLAKDKKTGEEVAVKFEELLSGYLVEEVAALQKLQEPNQSRPQGFAKLFHSGVEACGYMCLVMERLGSDLLEHMNALGGRLSTKTALLVAKQAIPILEYLHSKCMVHCDIKPENFTSGLGERAHHLYLIDFGFAKQYHTGWAHVPLEQTTTFQTTMRYASSAAHLFKTQSRKDDLEALAYMLVFLTRGTLPWENIRDEDWRQRSQKILEMKQATQPAELAKGLPKAFADLLESSLGLKFQDRPDYEKLRGSFLDELDALAEAEGIASVEDSALQWIDSAALPKLVPVQERGKVRQPDDVTISLTKMLRTIACQSRTQAATAPSPPSCSVSRGPAEMSPTEKPAFVGRMEDEKLRSRLRWRLAKATTTFLYCGALSSTAQPMRAVMPY